MKLILAGATGFIGSEILRQCLRAPAFTSIIVLSRRALPAALANHTKLTVIITKDFTVYPAEVLSQLEGADACIWYAIPILRTAEYAIQLIEGQWVQQPPYRRSNSTTRWPLLAHSHRQSPRGRLLFDFSTPAAFSLRRTNRNHCSSYKRVGASRSVYSHGCVLPEYFADKLAAVNTHREKQKPNSSRSHRKKHKTGAGRRTSRDPRWCSRRRAIF